MTKEEELRILNIEAALIGKWDREDDKRFLFFLPTSTVGARGKFQMSDDQYMIFQQTLEYEIFLKEGNKPYMNVYDTLGGVTEYWIWHLSSGLGLLTVIDGKEEKMYFDRPQRQR